MKEIAHHNEGFGLQNGDVSISNDRFEALVFDEQTIIHRAVDSYNACGEFFFVTASRPRGERRQYVTFYSLGFDPSSERWITDEWFCHSSPLSDLTTVVDKKEVRQQIEERLEKIRSHCCS